MCILHLTASDVCSYMYPTFSVTEQKMKCDLLAWDPYFMWSRISGAFLNCTWLQSRSISLLQTSPHKPAPSCRLKTCLLTHLRMDNCILWLDVAEWFNMTKWSRGYIKTTFWATSEVQRATVQTGMAGTHCNRGTGEKIDTKRYGDGYDLSFCLFALQI